MFLQILTNVVGEEDDEERGHEVVDSLNVAAGRVPHGPDEQNPLETLYRKQTLGYSENTEQDLGYSENTEQDLGYSENTEQDLGYSENTEQDLGFSENTEQDLGYSENADVCMLCIYPV